MRFHRFVFHDTTTMDFAPLMTRKRERFAEVEAAVAAPGLYDNPKRAQEILREHSRLKEALA